MKLHEPFKGNPFEGADEQTSHDSSVQYYVPSLGLELVYVLVRGTFVVKGLHVGCFNLGGIRSNILLGRVRLDYSRLLGVASISNDLQIFLKFAHPLGVTGSIF